MLRRQRIPAFLRNREVKQLERRIVVGKLPRVLIILRKLGSRLQLTGN
jgi:hypothetical protein